MANRDSGFGGSEVMYPAVQGNHDAPHQMVTAPSYVPAAAPPLGGFGGGPEILKGGFNQTWLYHCLRRRWLPAVLIGALVAAAMVGYLLWLFPLSSSITAYVELQAQEKRLLEETRSMRADELEVFQLKHLTLIKSPFVLQSALNKKAISQLDAVVKEGSEALTWLYDGLQVAFQGEILELRYDGEEDPDEMKKVVDSVIDAYENEVLYVANMADQETLERLTQLHRELQKELEDKVTRYTRLSSELEGAESAVASSYLNMLLADIRLIQQQIMDAKKELVDIEVQKELAKRETTSQTSIEQAVQEELANDPMLVQYQQEQFAIEQRVRELTTTSKRGNSPQIKQLRAQANQLGEMMEQYRRQKSQELRKLAKSAPNDMYAMVMAEYGLRRDNLHHTIAELEAEYEDKIAQMMEKGERSEQLAMLESEIEQLQEIERTMDFKLRSWNVERETGRDKFDVLQPATAQEQVNEIERYTIAGLGGFAAFCATCYAVALIEFRRRRLNSAADVDEGLGIRVLGVVPPIASRKEMAAGSVMAAQLSESIDNVRATLMHDSATRKRQVVLVGSPESMEGSTTVASHLALSLTRAGRRTLLIDGDVREPSLHKLFGMPVEDGFCEVLRSEIDISDAIRPTNTEGLWLLTAGQCDMDAIHAMATDQPQPIFEKLRDEFDFVIIDGAPLLGLSDSLSLGHYADGVILTVLRDHSGIRNIHKTTEILKDLGIRLIGAVVNGVPQKADRRIARVHKPSSKQRKITADMGG